MAMTGSRLTIARKLRGMTKKKLAEEVSISPRAITDFESGGSSPSQTTLQKLARALNFPESFFFGDELEVPSCEGIAFRARSKMTRGQRDVAEASVALGMTISKWMDKTFCLPEVDIPDLAGLDPELASDVLRREWRLGEGPIADVVALMESHGVRVFSVTETSDEIDAFSLWDGEQVRPFVFLTTAKSGERRRMDAAHELGHLVLHRKEEIGGKESREIERQANCFASAFLMPRRGFVSSTPRGVTLKQAVHLKQKWKVSLAAFVYRAHEVGLLTDWQYHNQFRQIGSLGLRKKEPYGIESEVSQIDRQVLELSKKSNNNESISEISSETGIPMPVALSLMFGAPGVVVPGGGTSVNNSGDRNLTMV